MTTYRIWFHIDKSDKQIQEVTINAENEYEAVKKLCDRVGHPVTIASVDRVR